MNKMVKLCLITLSCTSLSAHAFLFGPSKSDLDGDGINNMDDKLSILHDRQRTQIFPDEMTLADSLFTPVVERLDVQDDLGMIENGLYFGYVWPDAHGPNPVKVIQISLDLRCNDGQFEWMRIPANVNTY